MLQRFLNNDNIDWFGRNLFQIDNNRMNGVPPVNIAETSNGFQIEMAAPGYKKDSFNVSVDKNLLTIAVDNEGVNGQPYTDAAQQQEAAPQQDEPKVYRKEFSFSSFSRSFTLPDGVDGQKISGTYENGILTLTIPKAEKVETRKTILIA